MNEQCGMNEASELGRSLFWVVWSHVESSLQYSACAAPFIRPHPQSYLRFSCSLDRERQGLESKLGLVPQRYNRL